MTADNSSPDNNISDPGTWVNQYGDLLFKYAVLRLKDQNTAEDAVQETFLAALKAKDSFAGQSSERTWLVSILKNKIVDHFRRISREADFENLDLLTAADDDYLASGSRAGTWKTGRRPADWMIETSDPAEQKEFWEFLRMCIDQLAPHISIIFVLRDIEDLKNEEICNIVNLQPTNLRVILYRVRKRLRQCLEKNWIDTERKQL